MTTTGTQHARPGVKPHRDVRMVAELIQQFVNTFTLRQINSGRNQIEFAAVASASAGSSPYFSQRARKRLRCRLVPPSAIT